MKFLSHSAFARLRLKEFLIGEMETEPLTSWEYLDHRWVGEKVCNFTHFLRREADSETLRCINLDLSVEPQRVWDSIFSRLGLPLRRGLTPAQTTSELDVKGKPARSFKYRTTVVYHVGANDDAYELRCTFDRFDELVHVTILRADWQCEI